MWVFCSQSAFILLTLFSSQLSQGCDVLYLKEPPPTIQCNPYSVEARLVLECQVQIPASVGSRAKLIWLFQDSNQVKHQITDSAIFSPLFDNTQRTTVSGHAWLLYNSITLDGSAMKSQMHRGLYFCQVFLDGKNVTTLSPSSGLLVEDEDNGPTYYLNQHPCLEEIQVQNVMRCAGNISLVTTLKPVLNFTTRLPSTDFPYHSSTVSSISVLGAGATLTATDQREAPIGLWIYVMAGIAVTMAFCGITVMLGIFWLGHKLRGVRTIDTFKSPPTTDANMGSVWNEINLPRKQEKPTKLTMNDAYDAISEPEYVEIL